MQYLGLGTAAIGRPLYINIRRDTTRHLSLQQLKHHASTILDEAYRLGIRYFDTAPGYGMAEELLIDWLTSKADPSIEIATKWGYTYVADFQPNAKQHEIKEHSLEKLNEQWQQSKNLLPYLRTYQIHSATFDTGVLNNKSVLLRLAELKEQHQLNIGITTTGHNQVDVLKKALEVEIDGNTLFGAFQVTYNILDQSILELVPALHSLGKRVIIKEALANGRLLPNDNYDHYSELYQFLVELADKYGVGVDAIALRFCMDSIQPFMVLSGAARTEHLSGNLRAADLQLEAQEIERLSSFGIDPKAYWEERKRLAWN